MSRLNPPRFISQRNREREGQLSLRIYREMLVFQMFRDAFGLFHFDLFGRGVECVVSFAAFLCPAHVSHSVSERNARLGHTDEFDGLLRCDRQQQRFRIGQANVLARKDDNASRDETKIFAGVEHFRQPIYGAFFIGSAHALDERADGVVMRVTRAIINDRFLLDAFLGDGEREMDNAARIGRRGEHADLESVQAFTRVAVA